jgi:hypothetical protein
LENDVTKSDGATGFSKMDLSKSLWIAMLMVGLGACGQAPDPASTAAPAEPEMRLPVSLNDVMVALVNQAADPIWVAAWRNPDTDAEWRELERRAYQLELAGALLKYPGTGPLDDTWVANEKWGMWSDQLRDVGANAVAAVESKNLMDIARVGDAIVDVCEGCHVDFKLPMPTGGKFGELSPTEDDFGDENP